MPTSSVRYHCVWLTKETQARVFDKVSFFIVFERCKHDGYLVVELILLPGTKNIMLDMKFSGAGGFGRLQISHVVVAQMVGGCNYAGC